MRGYGELWARLLQLDARMGEFLPGRARRLMIPEGLRELIDAVLAVGDRPLEETFELKRRASYWNYRAKREELRRCLEANRSLGGLLASRIEIDGYMEGLWESTP